MLVLQFESLRARHLPKHAAATSGCPFAGGPACYPRGRIRMRPGSMTEKWPAQSSRDVTMLLSRDPISPGKRISGCAGEDLFGTQRVTHICETGHDVVVSYSRVIRHDVGFLPSVGH